MQAKRLEVVVAKTTSVEHLDFEIDALRKAVIDPINKVVQDSEHHDYKATENIHPFFEHHLHHRIPCSYEE